METNHKMPLLRMLLRGNSGMSLIEIIIVMFIFIIVIVISSKAFEKIMISSSGLIKSAESNTQGIVGLEIMRSDLVQAGYGLPWIMPFVATFEESQVAANFLAPGITPTVFNDNQNTSSDTSKNPRAVQSSTAVAGSGVSAWEVGRDYLVLKGTSLGINDAAKKWSYVLGAGATSNIKLWGTDDFVEGDRVVTIDASTRTLIGTSTSAFSYTIPAETSGNFIPATAYQPSDEKQYYIVYGVSSTTNLAVPYNRVDYYIQRPTTISPRCAPGTGNLYKAVLNQSGGGVTQYPLLECVADMQVVYGLDLSNNSDVSVITAYDNENALAASSAEDIRKRLKEIRIYILAQDGQRDRSYTYPNKDVLVGETLYGAQRGRTFDLSTLDTIGSDWARYRWKVYKIVAVPKSM